MKLFVRADASSQIGIGHVMRCLSLCALLQKEGFTITFLTRPLIGNLDKKIKESGFNVITLQANTKESECNEVVTHLKNADLLIIDHYEIDAKYEKKVQAKSGVKLFVFDDTFERHHCDFLINQNLYATPEQYDSLVPEECTLFCGAPYALLREEFRTFESEPIQPLETERLRVLITLGGADPDNTTLQVLQALESMEKPSVEANVIVSAANPHKAEIEAFTNESCHDYTVLSNVSDMLSLMKQSDLAITAGGSTTLETLKVGLPSIVIVIAENQKHIGDYLDTNELALVIKEKTSLASELPSGLNTLLESPQLHAKMADNIRSIELGSVIESMCRTLRCAALRDFELFEATKEDARAIFDLANDDVVRANSFQSGKIEWKGHLDWYKSRLASNDVYFYTLKKQSLFLGQVRFERDGTDGWIISISLAAPLRGCGMASAAITKAVERLPKVISELTAYIKCSNLASVRAFERAGFDITESLKVQGTDTYKLLYTRR